MSTHGVMPRWLAWFEGPAQAAPFPQATQERRIGFVVLHGEFAWLGRSAYQQPEIEEARQDRVFLQPFPQQDAGDVELADLPENTRIGAHFHQRQRVADDQLIACQAAVALALGRLRNDPTYRMEISTVGHELKLRGHGNEALQGQPGPAGDAQQAIFESAADACPAFDVLDQQAGGKRSVFARQAQADRTVRIGEFPMQCMDVQRRHDGFQWQREFAIEAVDGVNHWNGAGVRKVIVDLYQRQQGW